MVLIAAGVAGPALLLAMPLGVRWRQARNLALLAAARRGREPVLVRGVVCGGRVRLPSVLAADETGMEIRPIVGRARTVPWGSVTEARWGEALPRGGRMADPDREGAAPVLTLVTGGGDRLVLAFRSSQAVPLAGALCLRLGDRASDLPERPEPAA